MMAQEIDRLNAASSAMLDAERRRRADDVAINANLMRIARERAAATAARRLGMDDVRKWNEEHRR